MRYILRPFSEAETYTTKGTEFLLAIRGYKQKELAEAIEQKVSIVSSLLNCKLNWNYSYLDGVCRFLQVHSDELLRTGRLLSAPPRSLAEANALAGLREGSFERFALLYGTAAASSLVGQLYSASRLWELLPGVARNYGKGRLGDFELSLACASLVRRLTREPGADVPRVFGILDE